MAKRRRFKHEGRGAVTLLRIVAHANYGTIQSHAGKPVFQ